MESLPEDDRVPSHRRAGRSGAPDPARVSRAMLTTLGPNTSRYVREFVDLDRLLRAAVPSRRRIAVVGMHTAVGSTTAATLIALAFAVRRTDPVLLVDGSAPGSAPVLSQLMGCAPVKSIGELAADPPRIRSRADLDGQLTAVGHDTWLLPGDPATGPYRHAPPSASVYAAATAPFARYFDITVTDLGANPDVNTAAHVLRQAHALCLVTDASAHGVGSALDLMLELSHRDESAAWVGRAVMLSNHRTAPSRFAVPDRARRAAIRRCARQGLPVVTMRYDPALSERPRTERALDERTERSALRIAAALLGIALPRHPAPAGGSVRRR